MAITGTLTIIPTDFSQALSGIVSACSPNVLRVTATLSGGVDTGAYCDIWMNFDNAAPRNFRLINKTFNGTTGEFFFDFIDILPYFFPDLSDDELTSGIQEVVDTFLNNAGGFSVPLSINLYKSTGGTALDSITYLSTYLLFSSKQIGNPNGSNEIDIAASQMPNFLAQKNKQSYIYYFGSGVLTFEKVGHIPEQIYMVDNFDRVITDNNGLAIINEI